MAYCLSPRARHPNALKFARQDWQKEQELHLIYVAITRAKLDLIEVTNINRNNPMNPETLEALEESIAHWKRLASGNREPDENVGWLDCSLCVKFMRFALCEDCPVNKKPEQSCVIILHIRMRIEPDESMASILQSSKPPPSKNSPSSNPSCQTTTLQTTMNTTKHLQRIKTKCQELLDIAEKRKEFPYKWEAHGNKVAFGGVMRITKDIG